MKTKKSAIEKLLDKIVKTKEAKFGLSYPNAKGEIKNKDLRDDYRAYLLYSSGQIESYMQYKHYASFYDYKILSKAELFKWYQFFFEVRTELMFAEEMHPTKENFLKNLPKDTSKWSKKDYKELKTWVENEVHEDEDWYFKNYKVKKAAAKKT